MGQSLHVFVGGGRNFFFGLGEERERALEFFFLLPDLLTGSYVRFLLNRSFIHHSHHLI